MKHTLALWLCTAFLSSAPAQNQPVDLTIQFNLEPIIDGSTGRISGRPVSNSLGKGYNTAFAFYDIMLKNTGDKDYFQGTSCWKEDKRSVNPEFRHYFDLLQSKTNILRFPGGEIANFYHLGKLDPSGCFTDTKGYGVSDMEIISRKNPNAFAKEKKDYTRTNRNAIFDLIELCKEYPDIEIVYVMNLTTHFINRYKTNKAFWLDYYVSFDNWEDILADPDFDIKMQENFNAIRLLQSHGIKVRAIELGNELYMNDYSATLSINDSKEEMGEYLVKYTNLVKLYSDSIRQIFPDIPMGVPYSDRNTVFERSWNRQLKTIGSYFDAYVLHDYYTGRETHSRHEHCNQKLEERITRMINFMEDDSKKIWITEWNLLFGQPALSANKNLNNAENAAYIFDYTTSIQWINTKYNDIVDIITMHNLAARSGAAPLFHSTGNYLKHMTPVINPNTSVWGAYLLSLFEQMVSTSEKWPVFEQVQFSAVDSSGHLIDRNKFFMKPFWQPEADINGIIYFANMTGQDYRLSKAHSFVKFNDNHYSFLENERSSDENTETQTAYTIFYIDSISSGKFGEAYLKSDTAMLPANSIGIILTQHLSEPGSTAAQRKTTHHCNIQARDISMQDMRENMHDIPALLCKQPNETMERKSNQAITNNIKLYPNPASNQVWIASASANASLQIFNQLGVLMYQAPLEQGRHMVELSGWINGLYHYVVQQDRDLLTGHFVVQR
jgi:hypothetical protein